jgi:hypothetical protein
MALEPDGRVRKAKTLPRDNNLALQPLTRFERIFRNAIEAFAAEIFGNALGWQRFGLFEQTHRPVQGYPRAFAAITSYGHGGKLANPL